MKKRYLHPRRVCQRCCYSYRIGFVGFIRHYHQYTFPVGACDLLLNKKALIKPQERVKIFVRANVRVEGGWGIIGH